MWPLALLCSSFVFLVFFCCCWCLVLVVRTQSLGKVRSNTRRNPSEFREWKRPKNRHKWLPGNLRARVTLLFLDSYAYQLSTYATFTLFILSKNNTSRGRCSAFSPHHIPHLQNYNINDAHSLLYYSKWSVLLVMTHTEQSLMPVELKIHWRWPKKFLSFETYCIYWQQHVLLVCHSYIRNKEYRLKFVFQAVCRHRASRLGSLHAIKHV